MAVPIKQIKVTRQQILRREVEILRREVEEPHAEEECAYPRFLTVVPKATQVVVCSAFTNSEHHGGSFTRGYLLVYESSALYANVTYPQPVISRFQNKFVNNCNTKKWLLYRLKPLCTTSYVPRRSVHLAHTNLGRNIVSLQGARA